MGDLSVLGKEIGEMHAFNWVSTMIAANAHLDIVDRWDMVDEDPRSNWCRFYFRDRGESWSDVKARSLSSTEVLVEGAADEFGAEFVYLFNPKDCTWKCWKVTEDEQTPVSIADKMNAFVKVGE